MNQFKPMECKTEALRRALADAGLSIVVGYERETERDAHSKHPWRCDEWAVRIDSKEQGGRSYRFPYFTGLGLRNPRPVAPSAETVLYSLFTDRAAARMSFRDWCSEFGYDDDSIKALELYRECCDIDPNLQRLRVPADKWTALFEIVDAYERGEPDDKDQLQLDLEG